MIGPTLPDLQLISGSDLQQASWLFTGFNVGYLVACASSNLSTYGPVYYSFISNRAVGKACLPSSAVHHPPFFCMYFLLSHTINRKNFKFRY